MRYCGGSPLSAVGQQAVRLSFTSHSTCSHSLRSSLAGIRRRASTCSSSAYLWRSLLCIASLEPRTQVTSPTAIPQQCSSVARASCASAATLDCLYAPSIARRSTPASVALTTSARGLAFRLPSAITASFWCLLRFNAFCVLSCLAHLPRVSTARSRLH